MDAVGQGSGIGRCQPTPQRQGWSYADPVDISASSCQSLRILLESGSHMIFRPSGTRGVTLRLYLERYEPSSGALFD